MTTYLGIDYGSAHIGCATAEGSLATPRETIPTDKNAAERVANLAAANNVDRIVIGLPGGKLDEEVRMFGDEISRLTRLPVLYHPETLSTQEALAKLKEARANKKKLLNDHIYAACLILEDYLESSEARMREVGYTYHD